MNKIITTLKKKMFHKLLPKTSAVLLTLYNVVCSDVSLPRWILENYLKIGLIKFQKHINLKNCLQHKFYFTMYYLKTELIHKIQFLHSFITAQEFY